MRDRTFFRDYGSRRFIREDALSDTPYALRVDFRDGVRSETLLYYGQPIDTSVEDGPDPYGLEPSRWGARMRDDDGPLDLARLDATPFPEQYGAFRVTYQIDADPRYPRDHSSTEWFGPDQWPPSLDMLQGVTATGIAHIVFRERR